MSLTGRPEPVVLADLVKAAVAVAVTFGWATLDDATVSTVATAVATVVWGLITYLTRRKVTPTADPQV
jgi:hypothetical protein